MKRQYDNTVALGNVSGKRGQVEIGAEFGEKSEHVGLRTSCCVFTLKQKNDTLCYR